MLYCHEVCVLRLVVVGHTASLRSVYGSANSHNQSSAEKVGDQVSLAQGGIDPVLAEIPRALPRVTYHALHDCEAVQLCFKDTIICLKCGRVGTDLRGKHLVVNEELASADTTTSVSIARTRRWE